ncbi:MAG: fumarylacetoacetase [Flavobacteriaceae bacterium]|nr:fumarylacetoacetase [Flavobacteriaceae bacterium]
MKITANDPNRKSWLEVKENSDFPIQNIPFGVFITKDDIITVGTRIGDYVIDLAALHQLGYFKGISLASDVFMQDSLNNFIANGRKSWRLVRNRIATIFDVENTELQNNEEHRKAVVFEREEVEMLPPIDVGDFTEFSSAKKRASYMNTIYKGNETKLPKNWFNAPVGYHGRSSSIVVSGTPIHRPYGQIFDEKSKKVILKPSEKIDMEVEIAFVTTASNHLGTSVSIDEAEEAVFGVVLLNDWASRDMQNSEYNPLAPFLAKNFASTISPWVVTLDALEPFRCKGVEKEHLAPYLQEKNEKPNFDIHLQASVVVGEHKTVLTNTNSKYLHWSVGQQVAHHTINGCNLRAGDLLSSGTISGEEKGSCGSMLELTKSGSKAINISGGQKRTFFEDKDTVIIEGHCENEQVRIGFGRCMGTILPPARKV